MTHLRTIRYLWVTGTVLAAFFGTARAQTVGFALSYDEALEPAVQLRDLNAGPTTLDVRLAGGVAGPLEAGAAVRSRTSFGPLGTFSLTGRADVDTAGAFALGVEGAGALAATGLDASLSLSNRNPGAFAPTAAYALGSRPFFTGDGVNAYLALGATQRLGRTLILEATPSLSYLSGTGVGVGFESRLQGRRIVESDNGVALLEASTGPGSGRGFVAGGAEYQLNRRGLPSLTGAVLLGRSEAGIRPGVRASAGGEVGGFSYRAEVSAEPYRRTAPPYRANVAVGTALGPGALGLELGAALKNDFGVPPVLIRSSYAFRF
ncbi:MAG: hypothetical protein AVDCRST_MAG86-898 [uncultured Truepera sp.]|uniref:Uncharacterized protein n=1 Tax=uncultured Truepera sp. TaxID=543023 RepID=A0A6J4V0A9_9DEIN|nr:MAG: hypothetical protein AVDCRST_MAG86-898 [uncultured Truepera sp.]